MIAVIEIKINTFFIVKLFHMQDLNKKQFNNNLWKYSKQFWVALTQKRGWTPHLILVYPNSTFIGELGFLCTLAQYSF